MKIHFSKWYSRVKTFVVAHKIWSGIIIIVLGYVGYKIYSSYAAGNVTPQYTVSMVRNGTITETVTGSGQVSAENQLDLTAQVSGQVQSIDVAVGDSVVKGQLLATIDPHDALISLKSAQIAYDKLTAAPKAADLASSQNNVAKSYNDGFNSVAATFVDLSTVMSGMKSMLYDQGGFLSDAYSTHMNSTALPMRNAAGIDFDNAAKQYLVVLQEYQSLTRTSPKSNIDSLISDTYSMLKAVAASAQEIQKVVNYLSINQLEYYPKIATTAVSDMNTWSSTVNSDLASVLSAQNSITTNVNSLNTLTTGADALDLASQQLSLEQAQETYSKYFIRAPFDGIVGRIPVSLYAQAGASTVMATIIGNQKIATLSLNEVDAATVKAGDAVTLTFDAINDLTATGTVSEVDLVGTVSSGVVTYTVKVAIGTEDTRINPGMSVNATIITKQIRDVLVVPSAAVKSLNNANYVLMFKTLPQANSMSATGAAGANAFIGSASSTARMNRQFSSTSGQSYGTYASSTRQFSGSTTPRVARSTSVTISSATAPANQPITIGETDGTNTQILSGLNPGEWVVTKTVSGAAATTATAAPSLLSSFGGARAAGGTSVRATTAAPAGR